MPDMTLSDATEEFLVYQENIRNLSPNSITGYRNDLFILHRCLCTIRNIPCPKTISNSSQTADSLQTVSQLSVNSINLEELRRCVGMLTKSGKSSASINRFIVAVRSLFAYCRRLNYIKSNPALELKTVKLPVRIPRFMTTPEVDVLCEEPVVNEILWESRDHAIFEMLYSSGCRVSELAAIKISDLSGNLSSAIVMGKGRKERRVFFADDAVKALKEYLIERKSRVKTFVTNQTGDKVSCKPVRELFINQQGTALTSRGIRYIVTRYSGTEGTNKPVSPHAFRHTFATAMLSAGADVRVVQELLGHSSISTTQRYTHITTAQLIQTYNRSHPHGSDS